MRDTIPDGTMCHAKVDGKETILVHKDGQWLMPITTWSLIPEDSTVEIFHQGFIDRFGETP